MYRGNGFRAFFTKVVGVTHSNSDGVNRQDIVAACQPGESLRLEHEPDNPWDWKAVAVRRADGRQVGYLSRELAASLWLRREQGYVQFAFVCQVTGGRRSGIATDRQAKV